MDFNSKVTNLPLNAVDDSGKKYHTNNMISKQYMLWNKYCQSKPKGFYIVFVWG